MRQRAWRPAIALTILVSVLAACAGDTAGTTTSEASTTVPEESTTVVTEPATTTTAAATTTTFESAEVTIQYIAGSAASIQPVIVNDLGFYAQYGIDVTLENTTQFLPAVISGSVDIAQAGPSPALLANSEGANLRVLSALFSTVTQRLMVTPEIAESMEAAPGDYPAVIQELAGSTLGISTAGGSIDLNLRWLITEAGLDPDEDFDIVALGGTAEQAGGLEAGTVDAILTSTPHYQRLEHEGIGVSVLNIDEGQGPESLQTPFIVAVCTEDWYDANPDVAQRFVQATIDGFAYMADPANRDEVHEIVASYVEGLDPEVFEEVADLIIATADATFTSTDLENVNRFVVESGLVEEPIAEDQFLISGVTPQE